MVDKITAVLRISPFGQDMTEDQLNYIASFLKEKHYQENEEIFLEDELGDSLYIVISGVVTITIRSPSTNRKPMKIQTVRSGDILGEFSFVDGHLRSASAKAEESTELLILDRPEFEKLSIEQPDIALKIFKNIAIVLVQRVRDITIQWRNLLM
ncbi:MAG: cyclic nucleotide-binding domain-containing protein [Desulfobacterales bacterium]|nr:cyclic nucleotide-binding domain-containing protein [Desulfobacterales bacterium]